MAKFNQKTLVIVLVVLLALALVYIVFDKFVDYQERRQFEAYQEGAQDGYQQAIVQMMQQLATCQPVPLYAGNVTINAVAMECLQQAPTDISSTLS